MSGFITEEQFLILLSERLADLPGITVDGQTGRVSGDLAAIAVAVLDVQDQHGPVLFGD